MGLLRSIATCINLPILIKSIHASRKRDGHWLRMCAVRIHSERPWFQQSSTARTCHDCHLKNSRCPLDCKGKEASPFICSFSLTAETALKAFSMTGSLQVIDLSTQNNFGQCVHADIAGSRQVEAPQQTQQPGHMSFKAAYMVSITNKSARCCFYKLQMHQSFLVMAIECSQFCIGSFIVNALPKDTQGKQAGLLPEHICMRENALPASSKTHGLYSHEEHCSNER